MPGERETFESALDLSLCPICGRDIGHDGKYTADFPENYPGLVCRSCEKSR